MSWTCMSITYSTQKTAAQGITMNAAKWTDLKSQLNRDGMICLQVALLPSPTDQQTGFS